MSLQNLKNGHFVGQIKSNLYWTSDDMFANISSGCWRHWQHIKTKTNKREEKKNVCVWPDIIMNRVNLLFVDNFHFDNKLRTKFCNDCLLQCFKTLDNSFGWQILTGTRSGYFRLILSPSARRFSNGHSSLYWNFMFTGFFSFIQQN